MCLEETLLLIQSCTVNTTRLTTSIPESVAFDEIRGESNVSNALIIMLTVESENEIHTITAGKRDGF